MYVIQKFSKPIAILVKDFLIVNNCKFAQTLVVYNVQQLTYKSLVTRLNSIHSIYDRITTLIGTIAPVSASIK